MIYPLTTPGDRTVQVPEESRVELGPLRVSRRRTQLPDEGRVRGAVRVRAERGVDLAVLPLHQVLRRLHGGHQGGNLAAVKLKEILEGFQHSTLCYIERVACRMTVTKSNSSEF